MRLTRAGFLRYATYRQAVFAGLVTNTVFGFLRTAIVLTVFAGSARVAGYDRLRRSPSCGWGRVCWPL